MSKKVLIIFGHHNYKTGTSFNAACRDAFMEECNKLGHEVDLINIYEDKQCDSFIFILIDCRDSESIKIKITLSK